MIVEHNQSANHPSGVGYDNKFKFNGKELDDATQMYYYGARYYDPRISIFVSVDPLAEQTMEPYLYTGNNPIMFTDPTGMSKDGIEHDYKMNSEGDITLVRETDDDFDRILKTDNKGNIVKYGEGFLVPKSKKGQEKVAVDNIAKGILKDGLNLESRDGLFAVNGEGQPTLKEFNKFISEFSDYIGKEIAGIRLGEKNSSTVTKIKTYRYEGNTRHSSNMPRNWFSLYGDFLKAHFHTHPYHNHTPSDDADIPLRNRHPNLPFFIIAGGYEKPY
ncbi:RHS repeat-associated core domain-containing protein [Paenimyroides aestuarii]|nr:RHS repeat-associated core domain-containing protein [Paenimyroides aestuarii]UUV21794.1 RHS repeat-associated core domain-containing protein [Paenimyroides aestuarii]